MLKIFARKAAPEHQVPETAVLDTKHGPINMSRVQVGNATAYVCHTSPQASGAMLDVNRVEFIAIDRNSGEAHDPNNVMSEVCNDGTSDYIYAAERACSSSFSMEKAKVIVFFDHIRDQSGSASDVLKKIRERFPARNPALDTIEPPQEPFRTRLRLVEPAKPPIPKDFHYSC